jgi:hypothetical protein
MVSQLDLAGTQLCGIWTDRLCHQRGTYTAEGITAIADALRVNGALTALNLSSDCLKDEGVSAVCEAIQSNKETKLASLNFANNNIGPVGANAVAAMVAVTGGLTSLDLSGNQLCGVRINPNPYPNPFGDSGTYTAEGITAIADALRVNGSLTRVDVRRNKIAGDGAAQLSAAVLGNLKIEKFNGIPIKEMRANSITELDLEGQGVGVEGGMVVARFVPVMVGLTSLNLSSNQLCGLDDRGTGTYTAEGITAIADAMRVNGALTSLNLRDNQLCGLDEIGRGTYTAEGITAIADALRVNGALTALDLSSDCLKDEGVSAVCEAIQSNKETKLTSLNFRNNEIGPVGANAVAAMVAVTGALTSLDISNNRMGDDGVKPICEALKQNSSLKVLDLNASNTRGGEIGPQGAQYLADMLSVNGGLTKIE